MKSFEKRREVFHSHEPGYMALDIRGSACDLLALFLADEPVQKLVSKYVFNGIAQEYSEYREDRIVKLLIEIATSYRLTSWRLKGKMREKEMSKEVGLLFSEEDDPGIPLSMHEACNKLIHADEILFETRKVRRSPFAYMKSNILISGERQKKGWGASLWIPEFCDAALTMPSISEDFMEMINKPGSGWEYTKPSKKK